MYSYPPTYKKWTKSKTIILGHAQNILGLALVILPLITKENFPDLPVWAYGVALIAFGVCTYLFRKLTSTALK